MQSPSQRRVLITGRSGFTGRHLAGVLARAGWDVVGIGVGELPETTEYLSTDLAETERLGDWLSRVRPTHVIHLAAQSHVVGDPLSFYRVNVLGTESLLEALVRSGAPVQKVIVASSANVYGNAAQSPITEATPLQPMNHYARSKVAMELLVQGWLDRLPVSIVRPFNYTGPGQSEAFLFPKIVAAHFRRDRVLKLGNLNVARDISDVAYVCEAYRLLLDAARVGEVLNICSGTSETLTNALAIMGQIAGYSPRVEVDPALVRVGDVLELKGDPGRLYDRIGELSPWPVPRILARMFAALSSDCRMAE